MPYVQDYIGKRAWVVEEDLLMVSYTLWVLRNLDYVNWMLAAISSICLDMVDLYVVVPGYHEGYQLQT